ncbi:hypothetical protein BYT27DRAFT_7200087 [Phlegmacium glaucopus]|nr:hypothetical protein BYT27DRAFT_7200087 [Phlegmacium glaucopus]
MDERLTHNPHLEVMPDHAGPHYNALRDVLTQNGMTIEQAVQALNDSWTQNHEERVQRWNQQEANDVNAAEELQRQLQQDDEQQAIQQPAERDVERPDLEKKKPKMKEFDDSAIVGNYIAPRPAQYALRRIEDFEYVELWYLTPEGCIDATQHQSTQNDDTFGLSKVDDMVTLKSVSSLKASKNVLPNTELSFRQMSMAKNTFIPLMTKYQWSEKAISAFAQLFTQLELHPYRQRDFGERALIIYQARVRREWHDQLKLGSAFNIGIINEDLLQSIYKELLDRAQLSSINELRATQSSFSFQEGRSDVVRTPRRRNFREKEQRFARVTSGSGRPLNPSCSTAPQGQAVCALCLATDPHDTRKCHSETFWDGSKARCRKNDEGRLITPTGTTLCHDWNSRRGCTSNSHEQRQECSGCGNKDHGAQRCPRAQKKPSPHSL